MTIDLSTSVPLIISILTAIGVLWKSYAESKKQIADGEETFARAKVIASEAIGKDVTNSASAIQIVMDVVEFMKRQLDDANARIQQVEELYRKSEDARFIAVRQAEYHRQQGNHALNALMAQRVGIETLMQQVRGCNQEPAFIVPMEVAAIIESLQKDRVLHG
jgi:DNA repair ATPase RecN